MTCTHVDGSGGGNYSASVNRLVIDFDLQQLEFSVAQTIGTSEPINYLFSNKGSDALVLNSSADAIVAGGVRFGSPFSIRVDRKSGIVVWQYIDGEKPEYVRFRCSG